MENTVPLSKVDPVVAEIIPPRRRPSVNGTRWALLSLVTAISVAVFGYLLEHKLDHARVLLDSAKFQVNEVAYQIGYANPSHFIAAFKKKFGVTPKKYLMNLSRKVHT